MLWRVGQSGKSPVTDGFPAEFYKHFVDSLSPLLKDMYMDSFNNKTLPPTLGQSTISVLLKPNKDLLNCV